MDGYSRRRELGEVGNVFHNIEHYFTIENAYRGGNH